MVWAAHRLNSFGRHDQSTPIHPNPHGDPGTVPDYQQRTVGLAVCPSQLNPIVEKWRMLPIVQLRGSVHIMVDGSLLTMSTIPLVNGWLALMSAKKRFW